MITRVLIVCLALCSALGAQEAELGRFLERRRAAHAKFDDVFVRALRLGDVEVDELEPFLEHGHLELRARAVELADRLDTERERNPFGGQLAALSAEEKQLAGLEGELRIEHASGAARLRRELARAAWRRGDGRSRTILENLLATNFGDTFSARALLDVGGAPGFEAVLSALARAFDEDLEPAGRLASVLTEYALRRELPKPPKQSAGPSRWRRWGAKVLKAWPDSLESGAIVFRSRESFERRLQGLNARWEVTEAPSDWLDEVDVAFGARRGSVEVIELLSSPLSGRDTSGEALARGLHLLALRHKDKPLHRLLEANRIQPETWLGRLVAALRDPQHVALERDVAASLGALPPEAARTILREMFGLGEATVSEPADGASPAQVLWAIEILLGPGTESGDWHTAIELFALTEVPAQPLTDVRKRLCQWANQRQLGDVPDESAAPDAWLAWFDVAVPR